MKKGLLIVGHGSRSKEAQEVFNYIVNKVKEKSKEKFFQIDGAHMELCKPSIETKVEKFVNEGIKKVYMVPYFLYKGIHIKEDIPELIEKLQKKYPSVEFKFGEPIGKEDKLADILIKRVQDIL
ncbi:MAG: sirohydrochlorin chelatase [Bacillota bacterium]